MREDRRGPLSNAVVRHSRDRREFEYLDALRRDAPNPEALRPRLPRLVELDAVEQIGKGRGTRYLRGAGAEGRPMAELVQVLPQLSRPQVKTLLAELRATGRARLEGERRLGRWFAGREAALDGIGQA